jgi:hypothetical protein
MLKDIALPSTPAATASYTSQRANRVESNLIFICSKINDLQKSSLVKQRRGRGWEDDGKMMGR